jgi:hypothetical protein
MERPAGSSIIYSQAASEAYEEKSSVANDEESTAATTNEKRERYVLISSFAVFMLTTNEISCSSRSCSC